MLHDDAMLFFDETTKLLVNWVLELHTASCMSCLTLPCMTDYLLALP